MASCPDSDNSWVLAGSESLPVETLGPESAADAESERAPRALGSPSKAAVEESAGAEEGGGSRAPLGAGAPISSGKGGWVHLISGVSRGLKPSCPHPAWRVPALPALQGLRQPQGCVGSSRGVGGRWRFSWAFSSTTETETISQSEESSQSGPILPEKTLAEGDLEGDGCAGGPPGLGDTLVQGDSDEVPGVAGLGLDTEDPEGQSPPGNLPSSPNIAWPREEARGSSSEDDTDVDVEGLRRRRGREPCTAQPAGPLRVEDQAGGEGAAWELGISLNVCVLGALVLLGLGILLFSGALTESDSGPAEEVDLQVFLDTGLDTEDGAPGPADSVPSLQSMGALLDRLAKENQDVRLLQARLQTQKEELQSLMQQPRELEEENAQLRGALRRGEAAQRALEAELQQLRARLRGLEGNCIRGPDGVCLSWGPGSAPAGATEQRGPGEREPGAGFLQQKQRLEAEAQAFRRELERQRELLGSVQRDLEQSLRDVGHGDPARAGLTALGHRLARKLQDLEKWGQHAGVPANASEARFQSSREGSGKEKWRDGRGDRNAEPWKHGKEGREGKKSWWGEEDREAAGRGKEWSSKKDGKRQGPREPPRRSGGLHRPAERQEHLQWKEGAKGQRDPLGLWAELSRHKYRTPQGCSGVPECARQEGLAFGVELAPVRQQELASLLRTYLARLPWAGPLTEQLPLSPAYFSEDGIFRHDRLRFRDFVDALEDSLEEVAVRQTGYDDEVDDFESFIFSHFFGEEALKKRSGKKERPLRSPGRG
ncbi:pre-B-cell leukemia transcription factor-interacting protein 1 isoform X2 [Lutra lutra]|uniref:pre-B-cell leukemia transcription factor-interacting protein 1 isoform X2 n=1 Tax=Lutra lutra TaxID=9657 RepID=UPI001FD3057B|nr:pre-B-cell leukemia transcription factor-interacting protein 1 isoform X2 [Lutra lutra]